MSNNGFVYTRAVIARLLNLSEKRIKQLTADGILSEFSPGFYKLLPAIQSYVKYLQGLLSDDDKASDYNVEKAMLTKIKREDAELELKLKRNELHKASDIEFVMTNMLVAFKSKLDSLPYRVLPQILNVLDNPERQDIIIKVLMDNISEALNELADYSPGMFNDEKYLVDCDDN